MSGALHKAKVYFGLAVEEEYTPDEPVVDFEDVTPIREEAPRVVEQSAEVTPLSRNRRIARVVPAPQEDELRRITTVHPKSYNDAQIIGEHFREGTPVILNLSNMEDAEAKRLVDFGAGLVFGLRGKIERVAGKVFLVTPSHIEVAHESEDSAKDDRPEPFFNQS